MANKKRHTKPVYKPVFNLFFPSSDEGIFPLQKTQKTTNEALLHDISTSANEDPDSLVIDEIGLNIRKCVAKFGSKKFHTIVQGVIENDPAFEKYFIYKRELTAYHMSMNSVSAPVKATKTKTSSIFVPKALDGYPYVHVLENGKFALEYMIGVYGIAKTREVLTSIITKQTPYDQGEIFSLLDMILADHEVKGVLENCRADKDALVQTIDKIRKGLIAGKKYPGLLGIKESRDRIIADGGTDQKNFLLKRIEYWMDMIRKGLEIYQANPSWEEFSAAYEEKYPNTNWNKKMIRNIVQKQNKLGKVDLFSSEKAPKTMYDLMKEYKWQIPDMFQATLYEQDILTPLLQTAVFDILRNLDQSSPLVKAFHRLEATRKKQITQHFRSLITPIPDVKFDGGLVIFLPTGISCPKEFFTQWPDDQRIALIKTWVDQRKNNLVFMKDLEVLLKEHGVDDVSLRKGEEKLFIHLKGRHFFKSLSDLYDLDEEQQIDHIQNRLATAKERVKEARALVQEIEIHGEPSPLKRREKNPTIHKKYLDNIILPDTDVDALEPPPAYLDTMPPCDEEPLELREVFEKNLFYEDSFYEETNENEDNFYDEEVQEEEPLEVRKEFNEEQEEKNIDEYFLDSWNPLPEEPEHFLGIPTSDVVPELNEEEDEIPPYFLEGPKEEVVPIVVPVVVTLPKVQEQTQEDIAHYFLYGPDDEIVYSDYEERSKGAYWISTSRKPKETEENSSLIPSSSYLIAPNLGFYDEVKTIDDPKPLE